MRGSCALKYLCPSVLIVFCASELLSVFFNTMSNVSASIGDLGSPFAAYFERYSMQVY